MQPVLAALLLIGSLSLGACSSLDRILCMGGCSQRSSHADGSSSVVEYLYPDGQLPPEQNQVPELQLPVRVALAFLPPRAGSSGLRPDAAQRERLLAAVRERFSGRKFIAQIVEVPDHYLSPGVDNLPALQRLLKFDVLALVSWDQVGHETDRRRSWTYLTIVGAFLVDGTRQEQTTLVDLAVIDPATRSLLLRAGGTDSRRHNTNWVDAAHDSRMQSAAGYEEALKQMTVNLDVALTQFEADVKAARAPVKVSWRGSGGGGGGALGGPGLMLLGLLALMKRQRRPA